jgi:toxin-antitoxin system PIN domain toxin
MDLLDANILIGAFRRDDPHHGKLKAWLEQTLNDRQPVSFPALVEVAFVRIVTHPKIFRQPSSVAEAERFLKAVRGSECFHETSWTNAIRAQWIEFCTGLGLSGNDVNDACLAAIARVTGCRVVSRDQGFARFPGIRWFDPTGE